MFRRNKTVYLTPTEQADKLAVEAVGMFTTAVQNLDAANALISEELERNTALIASLQAANERHVANQTSNTAIANKIRSLVTP